MILVVSTGVNAKWLSYECRKLPMDQYANCGTIVSKVCNLTNHEKSKKHQVWVPMQSQARLSFVETF